MRHFTASILVLVACNACGRSSTSGPPQGDGTPATASTAFERLAFVPDSLALRAGVAGEARLFARGPAGWEDVSADPAIVYDVEGVGLSYAPPVVSGVQEAEGRITARLGELQATLPVTIGPARLPVSLTVVPARLGLLVGVPRSFAVVLGYDDGSTEDVTAEGSTTLVAGGAVRFEGLLLVGDAPGNGTLEASHAGLNVTAEARVYGPPELLGIAVVPASAELELGDTLQLRVEGALPDGLTADLTAESAGTSYSVEGGVASHLGAGLVQGTAEGAGRVVARNQRFEAACALHVVPPPAQRIEVLMVRPSALDGLEGEYLNVYVEALLGDGSSRDVTQDPLTSYRTGDADVAFPTSSGQIALLGAGETTLDVSYSTAVTQIAVRVREPLVVGGNVEPGRLELAPGEQGVFVMRVDYENRTHADGSCQARWSSADPGIASIDGCGVVTAVSVGTTVVTALSPDLQFEWAGLLVLVR